VRGGLSEGQGSPHPGAAKPWETKARNTQRTRSDPGGFQMGSLARGLAERALHWPDLVPSGGTGASASTSAPARSATGAATSNDPYSKRPRSPHRISVRSEGAAPNIIPGQLTHLPLHLSPARRSPMARRWTLLVRWHPRARPAISRPWRSTTPRSRRQKQQCSRPGQIVRGTQLDGSPAHNRHARALGDAKRATTVETARRRPLAPVINARAAKARRRRNFD